MEGFWPIFFLGVVLKIPVFASLWLVWWAVRATPEPEQAPPEDGSDRFRRFRRTPRRPRGPRRGPHAPDGIPVPACPPGARTRIFTPPAPVRAARAHAAERGTAEPVRR
ncbi:MAG TPA: hypothetical protein VK919_10780 [Solirubrobacterales bacterium]|nr:hypothetical protein [Solirubrobacterales bacterium]